MKTTNLIFTSTVGMNREQWLEFRQPLFHIRNFLKRYYQEQVDSKGMPEGYLERKEAYEFLRYVFSTEQWKGLVFPCVGASDVACLVGLNPYKSVIEFYYECVGVKDAGFEDNISMFWGKQLEAQIAEKWQYWEGSEESLIQNFNAGKVVRRCRRLNAYTQNQNFPWLFASLDRIMNRSRGNKPEGALECKTISGWVAKQWEEGIPPMYVVQLQQQLLVTDFDFGELAMLKDGRGFEVYPFDKNENICNRLVSESKAFFEMVKKGCEHFLLYQCAPVEEARNHLAEIDRLSPEPDGSTAYEAYLNKAYKETGYEIPGGLEQLHLAKSYKFYDSIMKQYEDKQRECSNKLKAFLKDAAVIDFGLDGKVSWKANVKGSRVFNVRVVPEHDFQPNPDLIKTEPLEEVKETNPF